MYKTISLFLGSTCKHSGGTNNFFWRERKILRSPLQLDLNLKNWRERHLSSFTDARNGSPIGSWNRGHNCICKTKNVILTSIPYVPVTLICSFCGGSNVSFLHINVPFLPSPLSHLTLLCQIHHITLQVSCICPLFKVMSPSATSQYVWIFLLNASPTNVKCQMSKDIPEPWLLIFTSVSSQLCPEVSQLHWLHSSIDCYIYFRHWSTFCCHSPHYTHVTFKSSRGSSNLANPPSNKNNQPNNNFIPISQHEKHNIDTPFIQIQNNIDDASNYERTTRCNKNVDTITIESIKYATTMTMRRGRDNLDNLPTRRCNKSDDAKKLHREKRTQTTKSRTQQSSWVKYEPYNFTIFALCIDYSS